MFGKTRGIFTKTFSNFPFFLVRFQVSLHWTRMTWKTSRPLDPCHVCSENWQCPIGGITCVASTFHTIFANGWDRVRNWLRQNGINVIRFNKFAGSFKWAALINSYARTPLPATTNGIENPIRFNWFQLKCCVRRVSCSWARQPARNTIFKCDWALCSHSSWFQPYDWGPLPIKIAIFLIEIDLDPCVGVEFMPIAPSISSSNLVPYCRHLVIAL